MMITEIIFLNEFHVVDSSSIYIQLGFHLHITIFRLNCVPLDYIIGLKTCIHNLLRASIIFSWTSNSIQYMVYVLMYRHIKFKSLNCISRVMNFIMSNDISS